MHVHDPVTRRSDPASAPATSHHPAGLPDEPLIDFSVLSWLDCFDPYDRFDRPAPGGRAAYPTSELVGGFARAVEEAGGAFHQVDGEIPDTLLDNLVADLDAWEIVFPGHVDESGLAHRLRHRGAVVSPAHPARAGHAVMGLTSAIAAVADTGSLLVRASHEPSLRAALLPPVQLCVLPARRLVPTAGDIPGRFYEGQLLRFPATLTLQAAPRRTNGPRPLPTSRIHQSDELHVILVH